MSGARAIALQERKDEDFYIETSLVENATSLFPNLQKLSRSEYKKLIDEQKSEYAKKVLLDTFPGNVKVSEYSKELSKSTSITENLGITAMQKQKDSNSDSEDDFTTLFKDEYSPTSKNDFPDVPRRKTSDEDRIKRLYKDDLPSVPTHKVQIPPNPPTEDH